MRIVHERGRLFNWAILISRNALNANSTLVLAIPCSTYRGRRVYPSQALLRAPEGGLAVDSIAMAEQLRVLSQSRLLRRRGALSAAALAQIERALLLACDLPSQNP